MTSQTSSASTAPAAPTASSAPATSSAPAAAVLTLTEKAALRVKALLDKRGKPAAGVRIGLKTKGCSGMAYALNYVDTPVAGDECLSAHGVTVFIDPAAVLFLIGSEMDYNDDPITPGFVFNNPNEKGRCGCGQSFHV